MSNCSNCYNGCTEIVSDKCVRYTGLDVPVLGIQTGDSLSYVEQALIEFLTSTLDGTGILITLPPETYCTLVTSYLPDCGDITAVNLFEALVKSACDLQEQVDAIVAELAILNGDYTVGCLTGVTSSSDTHAIVQAVITKLCQIDVSLTALALDVDTNYVKLSDLDALIQAYIDSTGTSTKYYNKMIPYTVVEYYGSLTGNFDGTGAGLVTTDWEKIYLCNGLNGTPDKRGRVPVGVLNMLGTNPLSPAVDPAVDPLYNHTYTLSNTYGANSITLTGTQIPSHTHTVVTTVDILPNPHSHTYVTGSRGTDGWSGDNDVDNLGPLSATTGTTSLTTDVDTTVSYYGGGLAHSNAQPAIACYYIMYIP